MHSQKTFVKMDGSGNMSVYIGVTILATIHDQEIMVIKVVVQPF